MYINSGTQITNTPTKITAAYNTWPYQVPKSQRYQHLPRYYIDSQGYMRVYNSFKTAPVQFIPGGIYKATPTRTGSFYQPNVIIRQ